MIKNKFIKDWVIPIGFALIIALFIKQYIFFNIIVPTGSMLPTIKLNDRILVTRIHNLNNLHRGEIIVFKSDELNETLVKRLVGLPGDKVSVKEDGVYVNNVKLDEPYVESPGGLTGEYEVPEGKYFFLGDNRPVSNDSRYWDNTYIPASAIIGVARFVYYPFSDIKFY